jgi:hypothetical protein
MIRRAAIAVFSLAAACASPTGPGSNVSLAGTWSGRYEQISCSTTSGDSRSCGHNIRGVVTLVLTQQASSVTGEVAFADETTKSLIVGTLVPGGPLPVSGSFASPRLSLGGATITPSPAGPTGPSTEARLENWITELSGAVLSGTTSWNTDTTQNGALTGSTRRAYRITDLKKIGR